MAQPIAELTAQVGAVVEGVHLVDANSVELIGVALGPAAGPHVPPTVAEKPTFGLTVKLAVAPGMTVCGVLGVIVPSGLPEMLGVAV